MVLAGWLVATVLRHGGKAVYDLPTWAVTLGVAGALGSFVGWSLIFRSGRWLGVAVAVLGVLVVGSIAVIPLLGMLLLVGGIVWMASASQGRGSKAALIGGLLVAFGVPAAGLVVADGPVVECHDGGASTSSSIFRGTSSSSGSGSSRVGPSSTGATVDGEVTNGDRSFTYRCEGDRVVDFRPYRRP